MANWWSIPLHRRIIEDPATRAQLTSAVRKLAAETFTPARVGTLLESYHDLAARELFVPPDEEFLSLVGVEGAEARRAAWETEYRRLETVIAARQAEYLEALQWPMPFFQGTPEKVDEGWAFFWDRAVHLEGAEVRYDFELANSPRFTESSLVVKREGLTEPQYLLPMHLKPGVYFYRVTARTVRHPAVEWQTALDSYYEPGNATPYHGVMMFTVPAG